MNRPRLPIVIMTAALVSAVIIILLTYRTTINAVGSNPGQAGMGDLQRYDAQQSSASGAAAEKSSPYVGIGELRRFEAPISSRPYVGIGELRRFEAPISSRPYVGIGELRRFEAPMSSRPYVGIGELRRYEAAQVLATAQLSSPRLPDRICPNLSTPYGERDSGASAPVFVLLAKGC